MPSTPLRNSASAFQQVLEHECRELHVRGIICFQSARLTVLAQEDTGLFLFAGATSAVTDSWLYSIPCHCLTDWLLQDESVYCDLTETPAESTCDDCAHRLLHRLEVTSFVKLLRGPMAHPWLAAVYVDPQEYGVHVRSKFEQSASRITRALLQETGPPRATARPDRAPDQSTALSPGLELRSTLDIAGLQYHPPLPFEQYLRHLLGRVLITVCPERALTLVGSAHVFCDSAYAAENGGHPDRAETPACELASGHTHLIDHLVAVPTHEHAARTFLQRRGDILLWQVHAFGLWKHDVLRDYLHIPLDFEVGEASTTPGAPTCFIRHAAMLGELHYVENIATARDSARQSFTAILDQAHFTDCDDACNLTIPMVDRDAGVCFGAINIESTVPDVRFDPLRIAAAHHLVMQFSACIGELRLHAARSAIQRRRHWVVAQSPHKDKLDDAVNRTCEQLARQYRADVELYEPRGPQPKPAGQSAGIHQRLHERAGGDDLLMACMAVPWAVCLEPPGGAYVVRSVNAPMPGASQAIAGLDGNSRVEIIPLDQFSADSSSLRAWESVKRCAQQLDLGDDHSNFLLVPLYLDYEVPDEGPTASVGAREFCAGMLVLRTVRRWTTVLGMPSSHRLLQLISEVGDLLRLTQRVRYQMIGMSTGAFSHELPDKILSAMELSITNVFAPALKAYPESRFYVHYVDLARQYFRAMLQLYLAPGEISRKPLAVTREELDTLKAAVEALVESYAMACPIRHAVWMRLDDHLWPLWLALRNWYSNAKQAESGATLTIDESSNAFTIKVVNGLDDEAAEAMSRERRLHPLGRPGHGRQIAQKLLADFYENVELFETPTEEIGAKRKYEVAITIGKCLATNEETVT